VDILSIGEIKMDKESAIKTTVDMTRIISLMDFMNKYANVEMVLKLGKSIRDNSVDSYQRILSFLTVQYINFIREEDSFKRLKEGGSFKTLKEKLIFLHKNPHMDCEDLIFQDSPVFNGLAMFSAGKVLEIDSILVENLKHTKNKIGIRQMPFHSLIIPIKDFTIGGRFEIFGIQIKDTFVMQKNREAIHFIVYGIDNYDGEDFYRSDFIYPEGLLKEKEDNVFSKKESNILSKEVANLVVNILDFINHPEVELKEQKWFNNEKRIARGQLPIPDKIRINLKGKLYKYIYENKGEPTGRTIDCKFWVRGHFIHFWNKKRFNGLYGLDEESLKEKGYYLDKQGVVSKWIFPYIKGAGKLKNKGYKLK
jgi:hypothetical protein